MNNLFEIKKIIRQILTEEQIETYKDGLLIYDVFKNPKSISRMMANMRGISDKFGNLYVINDGGMYITHDVFASWLSRHGYPVPGGQKIWYDKLNALCWMRFGGENQFYLSETYQEGDIEEIIEDSQELINNVMKVNPSYTFVIENINWAN